MANWKTDVQKETFDANSYTTSAAEERSKSREAAASSISTTAVVGINANEIPGVIKTIEAAERFVFQSF